MGKRKKQRMSARKFHEGNFIKIARNFIKLKQEREKTVLDVSNMTY